MLYTANNHNYMSHICEKNLWILIFIMQLLPEYYFFKKLPQISDIRKKS